MPACLVSTTLLANGDDISDKTGASGGSIAVVYVRKNSQSSIQDCEAVAISGAEYQAIVSAQAPGVGSPSEAIDYQACAYLWGFGMTTVVSLYLVSKYVGEIVGFIRSVIR